MSYSEAVRNKIVNSIKNELDECKNKGKNVLYHLYYDDVGWHMYICINNCILFYIDLRANGILFFRYVIFIPDNIIIQIKNNLVVKYESELSRELMKEIRYFISLINMGEDYSTSAYAFLKRLNKLEIEYIEDNSDDIDNNEIDHLPFQEESE
jgi:hypothetical protein